MTAGLVQRAAHRRQPPPGSPSSERVLPCPVAKGRHGHIGRSDLGEEPI